MGEDDGDRMQPILSDDLVQLPSHADARIDDDALLARSGREHETVRTAQHSGKALNQHGRSCPGEPVPAALPSVLSRFTGASWHGSQKRFVNFLSVAVMAGVAS
jgi:hypothetical protein